jgi:hypothetical protein
MTFESLLDRPIAFHRCFVTLTGSIPAALMLSQAIYWSKRTTKGSAWFYKTQKEWEEETGLSRTEQDSARRKLRDLGFWFEDRRDVPAKLYFRVDAQKLQSRLQESCDLDEVKPAAKMQENPQPLRLTETTTQKEPSLPSQGREETFPWCFETIAVQMGRKHRLPSLSSFEGARADRVVEFLRSRGFAARILDTEAA